MLMSCVFVFVTCMPLKEKLKGIICEISIISFPYWFFFLIYCSLDAIDYAIIIAWFDLEGTSSSTGGHERRLKREANSIGKAPFVRPRQIWYHFEVYLSLVEILAQAVNIGGCSRPDHSDGQVNWEVAIVEMLASLGFGAGFYTWVVDGWLGSPSNRLGVYLCWWLMSTSLWGWCQGRTITRASFVRDGACLRWAWDGLPCRKDAKGELGHTTWD